MFSQQPAFQKQTPSLTELAAGSASQPVRIIHYFIDPKKFPGEKKHVLGVVESFKALSKQEGADCKAYEWDLTIPAIVDAFIQQLRREAAAAAAAAGDTQNKIIVYATNTNAVAIFKQLALESDDLKERIIRVWGGHQYIPELLTLENNVDVIALPKTSLAILSVEQATALNRLGAVLIENMRGVPHNVTRELVLAKLAAWQKDPTLPVIPVQNTHTMLVVLGGNAPTLTGEIKEFTIKEAELLADMLAKEANGREARILITDHPRTGPGVLDAFLKVLADNKVCYNFFSYKVVDSNKESAYMPLLGAAAKPEANLFKAYITGESTSMVSEMAAVFPRDCLTIVKVGSMNESHLAHMHDMLDNQDALAIELTDAGVKQITPDSTHAALMHASAAEIVVASLADLLKNTAAASLRLRKTV